MNMIVVGRLLIFLVLFKAAARANHDEQVVDADEAACNANGDGDCNAESVVYEESDLEYIREHKPFRLSEFNVAGVNLASYDPNRPIDTQEQRYSGNPEPFHLFKDFDISEFIRMEDDFWTLRGHKSYLSDKEPSLTFYFDKVASKRWLLSMGIPQPKVFAMHYLSELTSSSDVEDIQQVILDLLPRDQDFCVKPNNKYRSQGVWLVNKNAEDGTTRVSQDAEALSTVEDFDMAALAGNIAHLISMPNPDWAPRMFDRIKHGIVVEERFVAFENPDGYAALEFKVYTIWGRVFLANWWRGLWFSEWHPGLVQRNGTMVEGSAETRLPSWVDWSRVVELAEKIGANKDFFRTDVFVGVPAGSPSLREDATDEERRAAVQYVVSETGPTSSHPLPQKIFQECVRLWIAGYKIGNYDLVPNTEIPLDSSSIVEEMNEGVQKDDH